MLTVGTNILIHPNVTGPGKFGRRLQAALKNEDINLAAGPHGPVFLASSILYPQEYELVGKKKIVHRIDNTGELFPWDGTQWTPDTKHVQYIYERADKHIFQTEWSVEQFRRLPNLYSKPKNYNVLFNGVPYRELDDEVKGNGILCSICNTWNITRTYGYSRFLLPNLSQIFTDIPEFKWMIVGKIDPLLKEVDKYGLSEFVGSRILTVQFPANLDKVRKMSDGFLHLLCHDSCPNSVVESAMYCLPGITLKTGAAELVGPGGISLENPTGEQLTQAIKSVLEENKERRIKTHDFAALNLDIDFIAERYANAIREVA